MRSYLPLEVIRAVIETDAPLPRTPYDVLLALAQFAHDDGTQAHQVKNCSPNGHASPPFIRSTMRSNGWSAKATSVDRSARRWS